MARASTRRHVIGSSASVAIVVAGPPSCISPTATVTAVPSLGFSILENQAMDVGGPSDPNNLLQGGLSLGDTGPLTAQQVTDGNPAASGRTLTFNSDGSFTYIPPAGFTGTDRFTYKLNGSLSLDSSTGAFAFDAS